MDSFLNEHHICNIPDSDSIVYKDECAYCFNTLESTNGLYICMKTFVAVCRAHLALFYEKSKNKLFLNLKNEKRVKISKGEAVGDESEYKKLLKEAYLSNQFEIKEYQCLFRMPEEQEFRLPRDLPSQVQQSISGIINADSISKASERACKAEKWDDNYIAESKHAKSLKQLSNNVKIPPTGWKCSQCELTTNLWLNLTDGAILCGRKFFDGSGGNNHAIDHYKESGYPLAVKLGTITPQRADVFSYDENDMVLDPYLAEHLTHFGIDIMKMEKTDKSVEEIEMDNIKRNREQMAIIESNSELELLYGPGFTGMINTGNSCYINSVMQVIFKIPTFAEFYSQRYHSIISSESVTNDVVDFRVQMAKLGYYLQTADYSYPIKPFPENDGEVIAPNPGIIPQMFRMVIGQNHVDFATKQQQDAYEFLIHLFSLIQKDVIKHKNKNVRNPLESTSLRIEDRIFCNTSQTVKYQYRDELVLSLPICMEEAINIDEVLAFKASNTDKNCCDDAVKPIVKLESCLNKFIRDDIILDYVVNGQSGVAYHSSKLETFPDYLWIQLKRFTVGDDWTPKKLDVEILVPDQLDLSHMKARGLQPNEVEMKDEKEPAKSFEFNPDYLNQLLNMGFPENACKKAIYFTQNSSIEEASNWLMVHIGEPDFDELPAELVSQSAAAAAAQDAPMPDESDIEMMMNMGFSRLQSLKALQETNNLERAADWAFNHMEELQHLENTATNNVGGAISQPEKKFTYSNGEPKYSLVALISHMGNNTHVGHYVCHIKQQDGTWTLFNDEKVQKSVNPPKQFAYLYLYRRNC